jgi:hypothetical protein
MTVFLSACLVLGLVAVIYRGWARWPFNVIGLFCLAFTWFYGLHMLAIATGLDSLAPDYLFVQTSSAVVTRANLLLALFLLLVIPGLMIGSAWHGRAGLLFPRIERQPSPGDYRRLATLLTLASVGLMLALLARYGSYGGAIRAAKFDKDLAGTYLFHIVPNLGAVTSAAWFLDILRRRRGRLTSSQRTECLVSAGFAVLNGLCVLAWGSRTLLTITGLTLLAGWAVFRSPGTNSSRRGGRLTLLRLSLVGLIVLSVVVGLRIGRDQVLTGEVTSGIADEQPVRQVAVAGNMVQYDAFVLATRDWPSTFRYRDGQDFVLGMQGVVPRVVWAGKPTNVAPGTWFRQVYEPEKRNGWPPGSAGEWYLNFGLPGLALGGLLSGILLGSAARALHAARMNPFAFAASIAIGLQVLVVGFHAQLPVRWFQWCLPLILMARWLKASRAPSLSRTDLPVDNPA